MRPRSSKSNHFFPMSHMVFLCKFGQNQLIGSGDKSAAKAHFTVFIVWWPWKLGQGHRNLNQSLKHPNVTIYEVWSSARSKTTKKSHLNWVCAACLYHLPRLHHHLYRLHRSWNNSNRNFTLVDAGNYIFIKYKLWSDSTQKTKISLSTVDLPRVKITRFIKQLSGSQRVV